jgi:signal transduction histidine kinase
MSAPDQLPVEQLIERFERQSARSAFQFFAMCGVVLGLLLVSFRIGAALQGDDQARTQVVEGVVISVLALVAMPLIRGGRYKSLAAAVMAIGLGIVGFDMFVMQFGVRAASAPFMVFVLLLCIMVFGLRAGLGFMGFCVVMLFGAVLAEMGGFITGPVGVNFVPIEINLTCLALMYLFAVGFSIHLARQSRLLKAVLEDRREELARALDELSHAQSSKERFVASLSTDVETPLMAMIQAIDQLQTDDRRAPADAGSISRMSARVMQFLENALGSARRFSSGGLDLELCSPVQMLQIRCDHFARTAQAKGLAFVQDIDASFAPACVGPTQLYLDAVNAMLDNAIRYTVEGSVLVRLQVVERSSETVSWRLVVSDTGSGIAEPVMRRMRAFLRQTEPSGEGLEASDKQGGASGNASSNTGVNFSSKAGNPGAKTGLKADTPQSLESAGFGGLVAIKRWADACGGDADILSRMGQGCIVSVSFELRRATGE